MANYDALINLKLKGFDELKKVEKTLNNITNPKSTRRSASQKLDQSELSFLRTKNTALTLANRAHRIQNKLKGSGRDLEKEIVDLERIGNVKQVQNLSRLKKQIELRKKDVLEAEKLLAVRTKEAKTVKTSRIVSTKTSPTVVSHPTLMGPHKATKGAGQVAMSIDTITKQSDKRLRIELKLRELEAKGVNTAKLRAKMGELVDAQNRKDFGTIKLINREIGRGIAKEESKLKILRIRNKERDLENKKILEANKLTAKESTPQGAFSRRSDKQSRDVQGKRTFMNNPFAGFMGRRFGTTRGFDTQSALISGGFPLLFGQGPLGAAAGALGGGIGGMFGQMGGFAGGIAATALLQQIQNATTAISEFGSELLNPTENLDKLVVRIKNFDRSITASVSSLQNAGLDQVAGRLASLTLQQRFGMQGLESVKNLNKEMVRFGQATKDLATRLGILVSGPLSLFFKLLTATVGGVNINDSKLTTTDQIRQKQKELDTNLIKEKKISDELLKNEQKLANLKGIQMDTEAKLVGKIFRGEKELKKVQDIIKANKELLEIRKLLKQVLESEGNILNEQIKLQKFKSQFNQGAISKKSLEEEQKRLDIAKQNRKILIAEANLKSLKADENATASEIEAQQTKLKNLQTELKLVKLIADIRIRSVDPLLSRIDELNREILKLRDSQVQIVELSKTIGSSFEESFKSIIKGTKSVQQAFADMFQRIGDHFLDMAAKMIANNLQRGILGLFSNAFTGNIFSSQAIGPSAVPFGSADLGLGSQNFGFSVAKQGAFYRAGSFKAFQYGGVVSSPTLGMIGEGGEPEYVIPSSKMDGAMARYSAGARGGAVIPGGSGASGTVAGSSGNTIVEYTGPVLNFNGDEYVPKSAVPEIINTAARQGGEAGKTKAISALRNSRSQRASLGL